MLQEVVWAFCASGHLNLSCVLDIPKKQQPCSPSSECAPTPALASVQLFWTKDLIFLKSGLLWVVILLDWVSNLTETTDHRVWGRGELEVW